MDDKEQDIKDPVEEPAPEEPAPEEPAPEEPAPEEPDPVSEALEAVKAEYDKKYEALKKETAERVKGLQSIIKELTGDADAEGQTPAPDPFEAINEKRNYKKW